MFWESRKFSTMELSDCCTDGLNIRFECIITGDGACVFQSGLFKMAAKWNLLISRKSLIFRLFLRIPEANMDKRCQSKCQADSPDMFEEHFVAFWQI